MRKAEMVRQGAEQLFTAEDAVETALCEVARLGLMLGQLRMDAKISAVVGQDAIDGVAILYKRLSKARADAIKLHAALDEVKTQIGARTVMVGSDNGKPPPPPELRVVDERAA